MNIGDGTSTLFWKDLWCGQILAETHPRAFSYSSNEDTTVRNFLQMESLRDGFHLPLSSQAREEVLQLQNIVAGYQIDIDNKDAWVYHWGQRYSSAKYYHFYFRDVDCDEAFKWIWRSKCTMKLKVFAWLLLSDRLNTKNMLRRWHYVVGPVTPRSDDCVLCRQQCEETLEHLFFLCQFSVQCWDKLNISWGMGNNRFDWLSCARREWARPMFMEAFLVAAWSIWKERNNYIFRRIPFTFQSWLQPSRKISSY